ncbi:MAG: tetratricopeptide repeat protein [Desulfobacterales bacterium]
MRKIFFILLPVMTLFLNPNFCHPQHFVEQFYDTGLKFAIQGKFREAKKQFLDGLNLEPDSPQLKQGLKIVEDVLLEKINPQTAIHLFRSADYANQGMIDESMAEDEKAVLLDPTYAIGFNSLGTSCIQKSLFDKAVDYFSTAIELDPNYCESYVMRGLAFIYKKEYKNALSDFNRAIEINPRDGGILYNRAIANYLDGNIGEAAKDVESAVSLGYSVPSDFRNKIRQSLNQLL